MRLISHVLTASKQTLIIAAITSRAYVNLAAKSGFDVIAIDCFNDVDTKRLAKQSYQVPMQAGQLSESHLLEIIKKLDLQDVVGLCFGAGFEKQPSLLTQISQYVQVIGNSAQTIAQCKQARPFFATCDALGVPHPIVTFDLPASTNGWLVKQVGGSGGMHINTLKNGAYQPSEAVYLQQFQAGQSVSCLFLADGQQSQIVGFNELWLDDDMTDCYRYGGAVSGASFSNEAKRRLVNYVAALTKTLGLRGMNSCDAICDGDDVYVLEVNPRLSATAELYADADLMARHIASSDEALSKQSLWQQAGSMAHQIIYADNDLVIEGNMSWPAWVADIPEAGSVFDAGMPVCTVLAGAENAKMAKSLVKDRAFALNKQFFN